MISPTDIVLLCDEEEDRRLFLQIRRVHPILAQVPNGNVRTYEQERSITTHSELERAVAPLHQDDRPDWIFCVGDRPVLVVELTKHAYTGDNGLQRFARFAAAAECTVPFIYFGPLSRVRDDELDGVGRASPRRLTSHLFAGMQKLSEVHDSLQLFVPWPVDENGLPASLPFRCTDQDVESIYGELLRLISAVIFEQNNVLIREYQDSLRRLAGHANTRDSEVVRYLGRDDLRGLLGAPQNLATVLGESGYFDKGKPDKAFAEYALRRSALTYVMLPDGQVIAPSEEDRQNLIDTLLSTAKFDKSILFYTGYKWRSDPHCGALVNLDYRLCREAGQTNAAERTRGLIVAYPRISLKRDGEIASHLQQLCMDAPGDIEEIFARRYGPQAKLKMSSCLGARGLFGIWANSTKQARLFRRYADLIIVNDGLIIGQPMAGVV